MEKKNLDWANIGFNYQPTDKRYSALWKDGAWQPGGLIDDPFVHISESAGVLQYSQAGFEGLKAYTTEDGRIVCFRPDMNAKRLADTCDRLHMPKISEEQFIEAVDMRDIPDARSLEDGLHLANDGDDVLDVIVMELPRL